MNKVKAFLASRSVTTHSLVVGFSTLVLLYSAVPAFQALVDGAYAATPSWFHKLAAAALGIWAFYQGSSNASKPAPVVSIGVAQQGK